MFYLFILNNFSDVLERGKHNKRDKQFPGILPHTNKTVTISFFGVHFVGLDMTYTYWADRCPNRYADRCVKLDVADNYKWRDADCAERLQFLCEKGRLLLKTVSAFRSMLTVRSLYVQAGLSVPGLMLLLNACTGIDDNDPPNSTVILFCSCGMFLSHLIDILDIYCYYFPLKYGSSFFNPS